MEHQYGTIYQKPDGRWVGQLKAKIHPRRLARVYNSPEEAAAGLNLEAHKILLNLTPELVNDNRVQDVMELWLSKLRLKQGTVKGHRVRFNRYVKDKPFGLMRLSAVLPVHIEGLMDESPDNHTRVFLANLLGGFFKFAEKNRLIVGNPFAISDAPDMRSAVQQTYEPSAKTEQTWTFDQLWFFFHAENNPIYRDYWLTTLMCGGRKGEIAGLRWCNMHLDQHQFTLSDNVTTGGGELVIEMLPKNYHPRKGYFGPFLAKVLSDRQAEQASYREGFPRWDNREWVFDRRVWKPAYSRRPGEHLEPANIGRRFHAVSDRAGLPRMTGPHGMRRTFATLASQEGFDTLVIKVLLGHKLTVTEKYMKPPEEKLRELGLWFDTKLAELLMD